MSEENNIPTNESPTETTIDEAGNSLTTNNSNDTETNKKKEKKGVTHRWTEETTELFKREYEGIPGKTSEDAIKELLEIKARVTLENDPEYGSQIKQVHNLLKMVGDKFASMVDHANIKATTQENEYQKIDKARLEAKSESDLYKRMWRTESDKVRKAEKDAEGFSTVVTEFQKAKNEDRVKIANLEADNRQLKEENKKAMKLEKKVTTLEQTIETLKKSHEEALKDKDFEFKTALFEKEKELQANFNSELVDAQNKASNAREELRQQLVNKFEEELSELRKMVNELTVENGVLKTTAELYKAENERLQKSGLRKLQDVLLEQDNEKKAE